MFEVDNDNFLDDSGEISIVNTQSLSHSDQHVSTRSHDAIVEEGVHRTQLCIFFPSLSKRMRRLITWCGV